MNVVMLTIELYQLRLKIVTHTGQDGLHRIQVLFCEDIAAIFCNKDQVHMGCKYAMPSMP